MKILFLGEGSPDGPARYLLAIAKHAKFQIDHLPDRSPLPSTWQMRRYHVVVLSDYRHESWSKTSEAWLVETILQGTGLLMIGGWASFTGRVGKYAGTSVESLLPLRCVTPDDRINTPSGVFLTRGNTHDFKGLDWKNPPVVCGYHRVQVKPGARTALHFRALHWNKESARFGFSCPALVLGTAGKGRTAAFLTDCAPHWAGGLVDWGSKRVQVSLGAGNIVEVGDSYLKFFKMLIRRLANPFKTVAKR